VCHINGITEAACTGTGTADAVRCTCKPGYLGNGVVCTQCYGPVATWLTSFCQGIDLGKVEEAITSLIPGVDWCTRPATTPCVTSFSTDRAFYYAGNTSYSLQVAGSSFVPAAISAAQSRNIMRAAFQRFRAASSRADSCNVTALGVSCREQVALLAVPGLLIHSTPGMHGMVP
jgi:hypothetical protein